MLGTWTRADPGKERFVDLFRRRIGETSSKVLGHERLTVEEEIEGQLEPSYGGVLLPGH